MRSALEIVALVHAIPHLSPTDFTQAEGVLDAIDHETDPVRWSKLNWEFHSALYRPANLPLLMQTVENLHTNVARYLTVYRTSDYSINSQREHREILDACHRQDADSASAALEDHLKTSASVLIAFLEKAEEQEGQN
jgi:DNA-binding GntR family transcriptional regulator